jgi:hypothetical protein
MEGQDHGGETEKKVSLLFLNIPGVRKKSGSGRSRRSPPGTWGPGRSGSAFSGRHPSRGPAGHSRRLRARISLSVGDVAPRDIKADRDLMVMDAAATAEKRRAARSGCSRFMISRPGRRRGRIPIRTVFAEGRHAGSPGQEPATPEDEPGPRFRNFTDLEQYFNRTLGLDRDDMSLASLALGQLSPADRGVHRPAFPGSAGPGHRGRAHPPRQSSSGIVVRRLSAGTEKPGGVPGCLSHAWMKLAAR